MKKNSVQLLFILCVFLVSFNIFAKSTSFKADSILFTKTIPFEKLPENIEQDMKNGSMNYLKNQQCLISTYRTFYKDSTLDHINIYATCIEVNPNKKIIIIGDRDGIPGQAIEECVKTIEGTEIVFASTECFV